MQMLDLLNWQRIQAYQLLKSCNLSILRNLLPYNRIPNKTLWTYCLKVIHICILIWNIYFNEIKFRHFYQYLLLHYVILLLYRLKVLFKKRESNKSTLIKQIAEWHIIQCCFKQWLQMHLSSLSCNSLSTEPLYNPVKR